MILNCFKIVNYRKIDFVLTESLTLCLPNASHYGRVSEKGRVCSDQDIRNAVIRNHLSEGDDFIPSEQ